MDRGIGYWLEGRASEGGRQVVMCARPGAPPEEVSPADVNVRSRVHEYGGGDYLVREGRVFYVDFAEQRIHQGGAAPPATLTMPGASYADLELSPDGRWLVAVEERPVVGGEPENRLVAISLTGGGSPRVVAGGHDFVSSPRFSPDGRKLAFTAWNHPNMPWDGTHLFVLDWGEAGPAGRPQAVAGGEKESIFQPSFSPDGVLTFVSDRTGWWNLYQLRESGIHPLCPREAEFGRPQWVFGMSTYAFAAADRVLCCYGGGGASRLAYLDLGSGSLDPLELPFGSVESLSVEGGVACLLAGAPGRATEVATLDLSSGALSTLRSSLSFDVDPDLLSPPEAFEFRSLGGRKSYAYFYPPRHPGVAGLSDEKPPLLVKSHGGPTAAASTVLDLRIQYWTSRGIAVVDVDYGGSTGYGREYRDSLYGQWGVVDVEDCVQAALHLASERCVDPERLMISGGSAGGYTTLCALTFHATFRAGASHYGIADLEGLVRDTHKFESRYIERLVAPYPEGAELYRQRSPLHFVDRLSCPVIFFQGLDDRIVPPSQAEAMVEALARRRIPHAYVAFPEEQHGFRRAENIRTALDGELYFYSQIFGFSIDVKPEAVRIVT